MKKTISYLYVILGAACWGFIGLFNRMLGEAGVSVWNRVFIRNFISLVLLTVVFALFHRQVFRIRLKHLPIFLAVWPSPTSTARCTAPWRWRVSCCIWPHPSWC